MRTLGDLIYWQYAKIIAGSAGIGKTQYGFVMQRFKQLQSGRIGWDSLREYVKEREDSEHCIYCGRADSMTQDHLFPTARNGPDVEKNVVWVCGRCNASKGKRRPYEYWTVRGGLRAAKYEMPRLAEGKYLKLLHGLLDEAGLLDSDAAAVRSRICPSCDLRPLCEREDSAGKLSPLCLDGAATMALRTSRIAGA